MRRPYNALFNDSRFKLGLFSPNCAGGMAVTKVPERWTASWENNLELARMADAGATSCLRSWSIWKAARRPFSRCNSAREHYQRDLGVFTTTYVVCRPTTKEAQDYHHYYAVEQADHDAVARLMSLMGMHAHSFPRDMIESLRTNFAAGHGVYPLVGDPDSVADEIERTATAGFAGASVAFVNYLDELPFFLDEVLPRLERKGLRLPAR